MLGVRVLRAQPMVQVVAVVLARLDTTETRHLETVAVAVV
jgi:hypothetical protein